MGEYTAGTPSWPGMLVALPLRMKRPMDALTEYTPEKCLRVRARARGGPSEHARAKRGSRTGRDARRKGKGEERTYAGARTEPATSVPTPILEPPYASSAASPPEEPPGE